MRLENIWKDNKKNSKRKYTAPEALYDLDGEKSVKTIHERNYHRYVRSPGAATLDLSKKARKKVVFLEIPKMKRTT